MSELPNFPMNKEDIEQWIPHRDPFVLIDCVDKVVPGESIVAGITLTGKESVFEGHFPENPVYPGVLMVEGMAQAGAVLGSMSVNDKKGCLLTGVEQARFKKAVVPPCVVKYEVNLVKNRRGFMWFEGEVKVDDDVVATVNYSARMV